MAEPAFPLTHEQVLELLAQNAEMRRLLAEHQWGLTSVRSCGICPECCGSSRVGHRSGCALEAVLERPPLPESLVA